MPLLQDILVQLERAQQVFNRVSAIEIEGMLAENTVLSADTACCQQSYRNQYK